MTPPKQVEKTFRPIQVLSPLLSQIIQSHTPLSSGFKSPNAIQVSFPSFPDNKIWIPIISTEYDLEGKKSKQSSNCDLLQFPAEVNKLCKHKRLQKILPALVETVLN